MPILQVLKEYRFDLEIADKKLNKEQCGYLYRTFSNEALKGKGNEAIDKIISYSNNLHIACLTVQNPDKATFAEYLNYLSKRAQA